MRVFNLLLIGYLSNIIFCSIQCDSTSYCSDSETCCLMPDQTYGCCPYHNATCCEDKETCCPENYKCDLREQTCVSKLNGFLAFLMNMELEKLKGIQKNFA
jgi:hypothetical protein